jgi:hypothetical protein
VRTPFAPLGVMPVAATAPAAPEAAAAAAAAVVDAASDAAAGEDSGPEAQPELELYPGVLEGTPSVVTLVFPEPLCPERLVFVVYQTGPDFWVRDHGELFLCVVLLVVGMLRSQRELAWPQLSLLSIHTHPCACPQCSHRRPRPCRQQLQPAAAQPLPVRHG